MDEKILRRVLEAIDPDLFERRDRFDQLFKQCTELREEAEKTLSQMDQEEIDPENRKRWEQAVTAMSASADELQKGIKDIDERINREGEFIQRADEIGQFFAKHIKTATKEEIESLVSSFPDELLNRVRNSKGKFIQIQEE